MSINYCVSGVAIRRNIDFEEMGLIKSGVFTGSRTPLLRCLYISRPIFICNYEALLPSFAGTEDHAQWYRKYKHGPVALKKSENDEIETAYRHWHICCRRGGAIRFKDVDIDFRLMMLHFDEEKWSVLSFFHA